MIRFTAAIFSLFVLSCTSVQTPRVPAQASELKTREGVAVGIPGLKTSLQVPTCEAENGTKAEDLGECQPADEAALFDQVTHLSFGFQSVQNPPGVKPSQRDFHPKQHACLAGLWTPIAKLPKDLRVGVFAMKAPVKMVLRYSNGSPKGPKGTPPDTQPDGRGLALKLVGVPGESILDVEDARSGVMNQDFVLINTSSFFLHSPKSYPQFLASLSKGQSFVSILDPVELKVLKQTMKPTADVTSERFFSQTPYAFGADGVRRYAKYSVRPCAAETPAAVTPEEAQNPNFLRERIRARLAQKPLCLIFSVQVRAPNMDVEDAAVEWDENQAPFVDVARLTIPARQDINSPERDAFCENISFNPWNTLVENRPVGAINRARQAVYAGISRKRRMENGVNVREPKATEEFFRVVKTK